jgi:precorrin-6A/cobalt-precorrin-6A reductase
MPMIDSHALSTPRVLLLGGTTEASAMARRLAEAGVRAVFSYAGRTAAPVAQPLPMRVGGFGGVAGLVAYLRDNAITHVIDATHPFAAQMSAHAVEACAQTGAALMAFERAPWAAQPGDQWHHVADVAGAVAALPDAPARVFLAIGRQNIAGFAAADRHSYLLRLVDPPEQSLPHTVVIARGPFTVEGDLALMRDHAITHVVAKNAGGTGASAKLAAARALRLPVIMIERPHVPARPVCDSAEAVMDWLHAGGPAERGV